MKKKAKPDPIIRDSYSSIESLVAELKGMRAHAESETARFFLALYFTEQKHMRFLRQNGCSVFADFLKTHDLCEPSRYALFKRGIDILVASSFDPDCALELGIYGTTALSASHDRTKVALFVQAIRAFHEVHQTFPSQQRSRDILRQVDPRPGTPRAIGAASELNRLRAENQELKGKLRMAESHNAKLRAENEKLKQQLAAFQSKKPPKKGSRSQQPPASA